MSLSRDTSPNDAWVGTLESLRVDDPTPSGAAPDPRLDAPLHALCLPTRVRRFVAKRQLARVRDLVAVAPEELLSEPKLGTKSVARTAAALRSYLGRTWEAARDALGFVASAGVAPPAPASAPEAFVPIPEGATWHVLLRDAFRRLRPQERVVVTARSGLAAPPRTLADIGELLGFSRERARQYQERALAVVRRAPWFAELAARLSRAAPAVAADASFLSDRDPLFAHCIGDYDAFCFLVNVVVDGELSAFRSRTAGSSPV